MREVGAIEAVDTRVAVGVTTVMAAVGTEAVDTMEAIGGTTVMVEVTMEVTVVIIVATVITAGQLE
jgi:hypothetical protein